MAKSTRHALAGAVAVALMLSLGGTAEAGGENDRSSTSALGNILHGLANAMNGPDKRAEAAPLQVSAVNPGQDARIRERDSADANDRAVTVTASR